MNLLPESVRIVISQALRAKSELVRGNGPFPQVSDVRPWKYWWSVTWRANRLMFPFCKNARFDKIEVHT